MNKETLDLIKREGEKIENGTGHGKIEIFIQDGKVHHIKPTTCIFVRKDLT